MNVLLPAEAFSVKPGGVVDRLEVGGDLVTHGAKVTTYAVEGGKVSAIDIKGRVWRMGQSRTRCSSTQGRDALTDVRAVAKAGKTLVVDDARSPTAPGGPPS